MSSLKICTHVVWSQLMRLKWLPLKRSQLLILLDGYTKFVRSTGINHGMSWSCTEGCCFGGIFSFMYHLQTQRRNIKIWWEFLSVGRQAVLQVSCKRITFSSWFRVEGVGMKPSQEQRFCLSSLFTMVQLEKMASTQCSESHLAVSRHMQAVSGLFPLTQLQFEKQT